MVLPEIIGLYSPRPRSGKGTAAKVLAEMHGYEIMRFSEPLRDMWAAYLGINKGSAFYWDTVEGSYKETRVGPSKVSYRDFGVALGDGLRKRFGPNFWIDHLAQRYEELENTGQLHVVIEDMRYPNEYDWVKSRGGQCWLLDRVDGLGGAKTISEGLLDRHQFDIRIVAPDTKYLKRAVSLAFGT